MGDGRLASVELALLEIEADDVIQVCSVSVTAFPSVRWILDAGRVFVM
jgi:hypothetical protein